MTYIVMAYIVTAYIVTAYIITAYVVMAYIVTAYIVMAYCRLALLPVLNGTFETPPADSSAQSSAIGMVASIEAMRDKFHLLSQ